MGHRDMRGHQCIVDELRHLAGADAAHAHDQTAECLENRARGGNDLLVATDHHRQRAGGGAGSTAAHGRIDERESASGGSRASAFTVFGWTVE